MGTIDVDNPEIAVVLQEGQWEIILDMLECAARESGDSTWDELWEEVQRQVEG